MHTRAGRRGQDAARGGIQGPLGLCAALLLALGGCARDRVVREGGQVTQSQADSYLRDAIRQSSEGVVLDPSQQGLEQIERTRLGEIAQQLRSPAAICFLERAIATMEPGLVDGEQAWLEVPEGQIKLRARIAVDGSVMATEVLESGFRDAYMDGCIEEVVTKQVFVESRDSFAYYIDIYYWVSLGLFEEAQSESFAELLRRRQAEAGVRAKGCLRGRVGPGEYEVRGLNLFDRDGRTLVNRIDRGDLPQEVSSCVASALKSIEIHPEPDAFVRPAAPAVRFIVGQDGSVSVGDERWLELLELEERAAREQRRAELAGEPVGGSGEPEEDGFIDPGEPGLGVPASAGTGDPRVPAPRPEPEPEPPKDPEPPKEPDPGPAPEAEPSAPAPSPPPTGDPSKPGTKLDLSPRRGR